MALENLKDIFEQANFGGGIPATNPTPAEEQSPDITKTEKINKPNSKLASKIVFGNPNTTDYELGTGFYSGQDTYKELSGENIQLRKFDNTKIGVGGKLGNNEFVLETLFKNNHRGSPNRIQINTGIQDPDPNREGTIKINTGRAGIGSLSNLDIKGYSDFSRTGLFGLLGAEPYVVHNIPQTGFGSALQGVGQNRDFIPFRAALDDVSRLAQFYTSPKGLLYIGKENITNFAIGDGVPIENPITATMAPPVPIPNTGFLNFIQQSAQSAGLGSIRKPFTIQYSDRKNIGLPFKNLGDRPFGLGALARIKLPQGSSRLSKVGRALLKPIRDAGVRELTKQLQIPKVERPTPFLDLSGGPKDTRYEDIFSLSPEIDESEVDFFEPDIKKGDFYVRFKDLRTNQLLYFRGYVTGITENVSPSFSSTNYIGRSEPVYMYERAERDISFTLRVYPANFTEQDNMYKKIEHLTSLAYPEYLPDGNSLTRMKPPFTELKMAHIGKRDKGQFGFIKSISYTVNEQGDWDSERMLPRLFDIAISYQILSKRPPSLREDHEFYGVYK
mgnify:FL=1|tara:strand:+ start:171 stop:1844 length:1674 start_codon:yes stop_codon:yes gene_type:complete